MGDDKARMRTLRFWLRGIGPEDFRSLHDLSRDLGACHRKFVQVALEYVFAGGESNVERLRLARRAFQEEFGAGPWVRRFGNTYTGEVADKDFKRQWGLIQRGQKSSVSFGPGKANIDFLVGYQCELACEDGVWLMVGAGLRVGEPKGDRLARRWELVPQVGGSRKVKPWRRAALLRDMERATKLGRVRLVWKDRGWEAQVVATLPVTAPKAKDEVACGVDIGMRNLLVASIPDRQATFRFGKRECARLWASLDTADRERWTLQKAGKREAARFRSDTCSRLRKHLNELASRRLVDWAMREGATVLRVEKLTGIRRTTDDRAWNRRLARWPWYHLQQRTEQKALAVGLVVEWVNPKGTSRTCSACGYEHEDNRKGGKFRCLSCGYERDADLNAANNIARRSAEDFDAPTTPGRVRSAGVGRDDALSGNAGRTVATRLAIPNLAPPENTGHIADSAS